VVVLVSLASGIALTIGVVALLAIVARRSMSATVGILLPGLARWTRFAQIGAGVVVVVLGLYMTAIAIA
jgi:ABC-type nickel/cobalt efflux system permease component RcnA